MIRLSPCGLALLACLALTACSDSPSSSEAKQVVQNMLGECPNVSIEDFQRVNGIPQGTGSYQVQVKYTLKMKPLQDNLNLAEQYEKELVTQEQIWQKNLDFIDDYKAKEKAYNGPTGVPDKPFEEAFPDLYKEYFPIFQTPRDFGVVKEKISFGYKMEMYRNLVQACPRLKRTLAGFLIDRNNSNEDAIDYKEDVRKAITAHFEMIKTDNGWMEASQ